MDDLLAEFLTETNEGLGQLDVALVQLERTPDHVPTLSLVFRLVHTIKGTCGFLGLPRLERVAHAAEDVLGRVRDGALAANPAIVTGVLAGLDRIKLIIAGLASQGVEPPGDDTAIVERLRALAEGDASEAAPVQEMAEATVPAPGEPPADPAPAGQTIRVAVDVLENLMTLVSELVLTRNQLLQVARNQDAGRDGSGTFATPLQRLSQITSDLQEGVMKTRMQPVGAAWNKLPRLVRDLARDLGKRIELVLTGAETELDRQVLELIRDPLTHMVRNSADHGLEKPEGRRAAGKSESGRISLTAFHEGGHIVIEIADDGRGLDARRIRDKAQSKGLATAAELDAMADAQLYRFIFHPGFSTAAAVTAVTAVTAVSGRGVGMDVVKTNIERIGGSVALASVPGQGSTFTIKIPLTLAIVSALIVEAAGQRFAVPQLSVVELVRAGKVGEVGDGSVIEMLRGVPVLRLRDRLLPLVSLERLLRLHGDDATTQAVAGARHVVVAQAGPSTLGIIVDRVFDTEEIVVKPVAPILRHITMFSGNTVLGDGSVIMILDPVGIARAAGTTTGTEAKATARPELQGVSSAAPGEDDRMALLLFRAGGALMAVPLGLVARLEDIPRERIEHTGARDPALGTVTQYRGRLMPLVPLAGVLDPERASHPVLVFGDGNESSERNVGLVADEIVDVVTENLRIELSGQAPGLLGTAVLAGRAAGVLDTRHWLTIVHRDWFRPTVGEAAQALRLLLVEDSGFFRQLLMPMLAAAGYSVTTAPDAAHALRLREGGTMFDAIISDINMPDMDGLAFVRALRAGGPWAELPVIALSALAGPDHVSAGRAAGFTDYVQKLEQESLLASLRQCLASTALVRASPAMT